MPELMVDSIVEKVMFTPKPGALIQYSLEHGSCEYYTGAPEY